MHYAAVLGSPIKHSLSPVLHNAGYEALGLDWHYTRFECDADALPHVINEHPEYSGFSVTMPAKFAALAFADNVSERAAAIGSANTLYLRDGAWHAENTDVDGLIACINHVSSEPTRALLIGGGGTARPAVWALAQSGVKELTIINRTDKSADFQELATAAGIESLHFQDYEAPIPEVDIVVSTVPSAVLEGKEDTYCVAPLVDVIYNPWPTPLVRAAREAGQPAVGGHMMLAHQAYGQFELFTGHPAPQDAMWNALVSAVPELAAARDNGEL
ncbi:MAG: shikimate dehydrogenase [Corynebacterium sp.]|nr:shikimate dehydrogenase [Corynebacterium sp.]